jgi:hypothetical protein
MRRFGGRQLRRITSRFRSRTDLRISTLVVIGRIGLWRKPYLHALNANGTGMPEFCPDCV